MSLDRAITDIKRFSQGGFSAEITFTNPTGTQSASVNGLISKHNLSVNPDTGMPYTCRTPHQMKVG